MSIIQFMHLICVHFWTYIDITRWLITLFRFRVNDASQRKECFGVIRTDVCRSVGMKVKRTPTESVIRVPAKSEIYEICINPSRELLNLASPSSGAQQSKRLLNSPAEKSPCRKAVCVTCPTALGKVSLGRVVQPGLIRSFSLTRNEKSLLATGRLGIWKRLEVEILCDSCRLESRLKKL